MWSMENNDMPFRISWILLHISSSGIPCCKSSREKLVTWLRWVRDLLTMSCLGLTNELNTTSLFMLTTLHWANEFRTLPPSFVVCMNSQSTARGKRFAHLLAALDQTWLLMNPATVYVYSTWHGTPLTSHGWALLTGGSLIMGSLLGPEETWPGWLESPLPFSRQRKTWRNGGLLSWKLELLLQYPCTSLIYVTPLNIAGGHFYIWRHWSSCRLLMHTGRRIVLPQVHGSLHF